LKIARNDSATGLRHELALYRAENGEAAIALRTVRDASGAEPIDRAWRAKTVSKLLAAVSAHDPAADLPADVDPEDPDLVAAELVANALDLRARVVLARRGFEGLVMAVADALHDAPQTRGRHGRAAARQASAPP
jgi:hypothetical protein